MVGSSENIQFSWGKKRAKGGAKMDTQFYESFIFDNVKYSLYDCVYLFKDGDPEPYIGKIVKIWQQNQLKRVKILWFFLPNEIRNYLRDAVMEKEIFLASGDGTGLADINPLEAIAGKCTVVCISKDERNRQPSPREQAMADYIFYRFFDVGNCTLSDQLPEKIAGQEVNVLLNPKDEQVTSVPDLEVRGMDQEDEGPVAAIPLPQSAVKEEDGSLAAAVSLAQSTIKEDGSLVAPFPLPQSTVKEDESPVAPIPIPLPQPAVKKESVPKPTERALSGERPSKKLKLSQDVAVQKDRRKWFKIPWDDRLRKAVEEGTLVYIQNLDLQFAGADIEELILAALNLHCIIAKPINHPTYDDPNNGKAYAIFKTKGDADTAVSKINAGLVVGGRPLYCSKGLLKVPKPSATLVGHLSIHNLRMTQKQREDQKKAVSTSHCSQPNTIEYDLALDWMLVREKQERKFRILQMRHKEERKKFGNLGSKNVKVEK